MWTVDQIERAKKLALDYCVQRLGRDAGATAGMWLSDVGGVGDVCYVIAHGAHAEELLGTTEEVQTQVAEWVGFADRLCDAADAECMLQRLNAHLKVRSVLAGENITVADLGVFAAVHETKCQALRLENLPHLVRWLDSVQHTQTLYPAISGSNSPEEEKQP